jgi:hypothetical protein
MGIEHRAEGIGKKTEKEINRRHAQTTADVQDHLEAESEQFADENQRAHYHPQAALLYTRWLGFILCADCSQVFLEIILPDLNLLTILDLRRQFGVSLSERP